MIIDIHNHITHSASPYSLPPEAYIDAMDENGIETAVILGKDHGDLGDRQGVNIPDEDIAAFVRLNRERFIGFTAVHPDRGSESMVARVQKAVHDFGFRGIKMNPASGFYPNDVLLYPVYEKAVELSVPVLVHTGLKPPSEGSRLKYCRPLYLDDLTVDFPDLKIIIAHAGFPWIDETILVCLYDENVYVDISTLNQIEEVMGEQVLLQVMRKLFRSLGSGRIVFGSDGIFNYGPLVRAVEKAEFLTGRDTENIFFRNAAKILGTV